ncbi:MAG: hypothetical protein NC421_07300 [Lachnospiraceae bacterium]|nr:hypothetical protein [Lachnospiraceae bacterium]
MIKTNVEVITPAVAAEYLKTNAKRQRPLNKGNIAFYARMMSDGQWQLNGDAIRFDINNELIDGQHRLAACVESGVPFETVVVRNINEDCFYTIDTGYNRSKGQILQLKGVPNANGISAAITCFIRFGQSRTTSLDATNSVKASAKTSWNNKVSTEDILKVYNLRPQYWQDLHNTSRQMYDRCRLLTSREVCGIISHLNLRLDYDYSYVMDFFEQLFYEERTERDVIRKLRKKLIDSCMGAIKLTSQYKTQLIIKTWNYYKSGDNPRILRWQPSVEKEQTFE